MNKLTNNPLKDLKGDLLKTRNNKVDFDVEEEMKADAPKEEPKTEEKIINQEEIKKVEKAEEQKKVQRISRTYKFLPSLYDDIKKVLYMDRELRGNETTLITKAVENYIYSTEGKELIKQYDEMKGGK